MNPEYIVALAFILIALGLVIFLSLPRSSSQSDAKPIDYSPAMQAQRVSAIRQLQKKGIIDKVECGSPQSLWILPTFYVLKFADKSAISIQAFAFHDDIAQVDAYAKLHLPVFRQFSVLLFERVLDFDRAPHGIDYAGELCQQIITWCINHPATVVLDQRGDEDTIGRQGADGGFFIVAHEATVPRHIRAEDRRQFAFHADGRRLLRHHSSS